MAPRLLRLSICLLFWARTLDAQPPVTYDPPLKGPLLTTGTFGELRSNHYHGGLDFRAAVGTPIYAVADGYVSRLVAKGGGYGQAVYIDHPDGRRSVYGHMESLAPKLLDTLRAAQYARESFAVDLRFDNTALPVRRGQRIGTVGNRGQSFGPHLHFEIRETEGDAPLNPLSLGFPIADTRQPQLLRLRVYEIEHGRDARATTHTLSQGLPDTLRVGTPTVGFGVSAYDRQNGMPNRNGIYGARLTVDSNEVFAFTYDRIAYDDTEYLNALTDYAQWKEKRRWYYLLFARTPRAVFWEDGPRRRTGTLHLTAGRAVNVTITLSDYAGNDRELSFPLLFDPSKGGMTRPMPEKGSYRLPAGQGSIVDTGGMRLTLDKDALYNDLTFDYARLADRSDGLVSDVFQLHNGSTPLHGSAELVLPPRLGLPDSLRRRVYVGRCDGEEGFAFAGGGEWTGDGRVRTHIGNFGSYALLLDTVPPNIRIRRFPTDLRGRGGFSMLIDDGVGGGLDYRATIDGRWVLMEYDAKSGRLNHVFDDNYVAVGGNRMHDFELVVSDGRKNVSRFRRRFRR